MRKRNLIVILSGVVLTAAVVTGFNIRKQYLQREKSIYAKNADKEKYIKLSPGTGSESKQNTSGEVEKENVLKEDESQEKQENKISQKPEDNAAEQNDSAASNNSSASQNLPYNNVPVQIDKIEEAKKAAADYIGNKDVGIYFIDINSGKGFGINENKIYYSASTGKLPGILYTQKKLNEGVINKDTKFEYHDYVNNIPGAMIRGGTGVLQNNVQEGKNVTVQELLKDTCSYSDNLASNMLGYYVCDKNSGAFKYYIGNVILRNIDTFAKQFSAKETALLMKEVYNQGGQSIDNLQNTSWDKVKIPKYLPVKVAHKIGINGAYNHDVAAVYANNPYVISVMTNGASDEFIAQLSKKIYDRLQ